MREECKLYSETLFHKENKFNIVKYQTLFVKNFIMITMLNNFLILKKIYIHIYIHNDNTVINKLIDPKSEKSQLFYVS